MADGGPSRLSPELQLASNINRYGVHAVMGRPLYHHEILSMNIAEKIYNAYHERAKSDNMAGWADSNPDKTSMLNEAMLLARQYGW